MDDKTIKTQLAEVEDALRRNEEERTVLNDLISGYRGWLKLRAAGTHGPAVQIPLGIEARIAPKSTEPQRRSTRPQKGERSLAKGSVSMRAAVRQAIQEQAGRPIHVTQILERATELGARTDGKEPKGVVDLMAYSLAKTTPIEKVGPRLWRWIGE